MREREKLRALRKVAATQGALKAASEASLAHALKLERARDEAVAAAEGRLEEAMDDWRGALTQKRVDAGLIFLFSQAPQWRRSELEDAKTSQTKAQIHTDSQRVRHGEITARLRRSLSLGKRLAKRLARKQEEKLLSALEEIASRAIP